MTTLTRREKWIMKPRDSRERLAAYYMVMVPTILSLILLVSERVTLLTWFLIDLAMIAVALTLFGVWWQKRTPAS